MELQFNNINDILKINKKGYRYYVSNDEKDNIFEFGVKICGDVPFDHRNEFGDQSKDSEYFKQQNDIYENSIGLAHYFGVRGGDYIGKGLGTKVLYKIFKDNKNLENILCYTLGQNSNGEKFFRRVGAQLLYSHKNSMLKYFKINRFEFLKYYNSKFWCDYVKNNK